MIPEKPAPGHSRPKDGVASLAYDPGVATGFLGHAKQKAKARL
jgi:hypothetical protein